jgi:uncharacterized protein (TIGR02246 family)
VLDVRAWTPVVAVDGNRLATAIIHADLGACTRLPLRQRFTFTSSVVDRAPPGLAMPAQGHRRFPVGPIELQKPECLFRPGPVNRASERHGPESAFRLEFIVRKSLFFALAVALTAVGSSCLVARASSTDAAAITALYKQFGVAFEHKDVNGIMSLYVPGASLFVYDVGPPREHRGWNDYREDWKQLFAGFKDNPTFEIIDFGMTIDSDVAYTHSAQRITVNTGGKARTTIVVRVTDVLRKMNGKWLIVQEHVSIPVDLNTMKPDPLSKP